MPQSRQPKENPPSLFSVEKTKWARAIEHKDKISYMEPYAQMDGACAMRKSLSDTCCANKEKKNSTGRIGHALWKGTQQRSAACGRTRDSA